MRGLATLAAACGEDCIAFAFAAFEHAAIPKADDAQAVRAEQGGSERVVFAPFGMASAVEARCSAL